MIRIALLILALFAFEAPASAAGRVALVVGVGRYQHIPALQNPVNDAEAMARVLARTGFEVRKVINPDRAALEAAIRRFGQSAQGAEAAMFYFAGHAVEVAGRNWLLPVSAKVTAAADIRFEAIDLEAVLEQTDGTARVGLIFLDACRDNPFRANLGGGTRSLSRGGLTAPAATGAGTLFAFATAPGVVAADGKGRNSPFTEALVKHLPTPGLEIREMLSRVRADVRKATGGRQVPWENSALEGQFHFVPPAAPAQVAAAAQAARPPEPAAAAVAAEPAAERAFDPDAFAAQVSRRLAALAPNSPEEQRRALAERYLMAEPAKALAIVPGGDLRSPHFAWAWESPDTAETRALELCQFVQERPCALVAVNDSVIAARQGSQRRNMPRIAYAGEFEPAQIPLVEAAVRQRDDIVAYWYLPGPKAIAMSTRGLMQIEARAPTQREAEEKALADCNGRSRRSGETTACRLYAIGNQVVLPRWLTEAATEADTPIVPEADPSRLQRRAAYRALELGVPGMNTRLRDEVARLYAAAEGGKALALGPGERARFFHVQGLADRTGTDEIALERCQLFHGQPCHLLVANEEVRIEKNALLAQAEEAPRLRHARRFDPAQVPGLEAAARLDPALTGYAARPQPKAVALHPFGGAFVSGEARDAGEAEEQALSRCREDLARRGREGPCLLYASGNQIVLKARATQPLARQQVTRAGP